MTSVFGAGDLQIDPLFTSRLALESWRPHGHPRPLTARGGGTVGRLRSAHGSSSTF
jgi:hypothetical protein